MALFDQMRSEIVPALLKAAYDQGLQTPRALAAALEWSQQDVSDLMSGTRRRASLNRLVEAWERLGGSAELRLIPPKR